MRLLLLSITLAFAFCSGFSQDCTEVEISLGGSQEWCDDIAAFIDFGDGSTQTIQHYCPSLAGGNVITTVVCVPNGCTEIQLCSTYTNFNPNACSGGIGSSSGQFALSIDGNEVIPLNQFYSGETVYFSVNGLNCPCMADVNFDGVMDIADFLDFNTAFGSACNNCPEDLTGDGVVDVSDFLQFNTHFDSVCGP